MSNNEQAGNLRDKYYRPYENALLSMNVIQYLVVRRWSRYTLCVYFGLLYALFDRDSEKKGFVPGVQKIPGKAGIQSSTWSAKHGAGVKARP